jgi:hypothetical protein
MPKYFLILLIALSWPLEAASIESASPGVARFVVGYRSELGQIYTKSLARLAILVPVPSVADRRLFDILG